VANEAFAVFNDDCIGNALMNVTVK